MELEKQQNLFFVADYGEGIRITAAMIGIILITCLCAYLLIYNIMYLSVSGNIRYYGLLQTVGMTGRQVYRFVQRQMGMIGIAGTAGGLITGGTVSFLIVPSIARSLSGYTAIEGSVDVSFHPAAVILTVVVTALTVYIGSRKPAKLATSVSPVDALRYRRAASGKRGCKNTGKGSITLRMAKQQIFGDRKKSVSYTHLDVDKRQTPDELLKEHHQEMTTIKEFMYKNLGRHLMNRNIKKIRNAK